jgi:hypothetical protein
MACAGERATIHATASQVLLLTALDISTLFGGTYVDHWHAILTKRLQSTQQAISSQAVMNRENSLKVASGGKCDIGGIASRVADILNQVQHTDGRCVVTHRGKAIAGFVSLADHALRRAVEDHLDGV